MKTVLTFGVFDMLHLGHVRLFYNIKKTCREKYGEEVYLKVAVQEQSYIEKFKPGTKVAYNTEERVFMLNSIKYVDEVVVYNVVADDMKVIPFDTLALGPDQISCINMIPWCEENGKDVVFIQRTEGISSSLLREYNSKAK